MQSAIEYLKKKNITSIGAVGFCWGGKMVFLGSGDHLFHSVASTSETLLTNIFFIKLLILLSLPKKMLKKLLDQLVFSHPRMKLPWKIFNTP
jgi:hypothetical protein